MFRSLWPTRIGVGKFQSKFVARCLQFPMAHDFGPIILRHFDFKSEPDSDFRSLFQRRFSGKRQRPASMSRQPSRLANTAQ